MNHYINFGEELSDISISINLDISLKEAVGLMTLIMLNSEVGLQDTDLSESYGQIMEQVEQYGNIYTGDDEDE